MQQDSSATRAVALVENFFQAFLAFTAFAGTSLDGPDDIVLGHVAVFGFLDGQAEAEIHLRVCSTTVTDRQSDVAAQFGENGPALGIRRPFLVLNGGPFGVA